MNKWLSALKGKTGRQLLPVLEDMRGRENAVLICSFGGDDPAAPLGAHLAESHSAAIVAGVRKLAEAGGCDDVILYGAQADVVSIGDRLTETGLTVTVIAGPASPVLREPTALYSVLDTGVIRAGNAEEAYKKMFQSYGYQGRPTLVVDAETAYQAYRLTEGLPMSKHIALLGNSTEIREADIGTALQTLTDTSDVKAALLGGVCGKFIGPAELGTAVIAYDYLFDSVRVLGNGDCIVSETAALYRSAKELSCQKCVLCREGSWQLAAVLSDMTEGKAGREDIALIEDIGPLIAAGALCAFGKSMVSPVLSALTVCRDEVTEHLAAKSCAAGKCRGLLSYLIDPALCVGCGECLDICPEEAIEGEDGFIHMLDEKLCVRCGKCLPVCPEGAVKFGVKLKVPKKLTKVGKFH